MFLLISFIVCLLLVVAFWYRKRAYNPFNLPQTGFNWPIFGQYKEIMEMSFNKYIHHYYQKFGENFVYPFVGKQVVVFAGEEAVNFINKCERDGLLGRMLLGNVATLLGREENSPHEEKSEWKGFREALSPSLLQSTTLNNLIPQLKKVVQMGLTENILDAKVIANITFGNGWLYIVGPRAFDTMPVMQAHYQNIGAALFSWPINLPGTQLNKALASREAIRKGLHDIISSSPHLLDDPNYVIGAVKKHIDEYPIVTIEQRALGLLFAAQHTTNSNISELVWNLANHPPVLSKLTDEIRRSPVPTTMAEINNLEYLNKVVAESLRISAGAGVNRQLQTDIKYKNLFLPAGTHIFIYLAYEHFDLQNAFAFDPDREEKYKFAGFGTGPRNCLGKMFAIMQMKLFVIEILRNYDVKVVKGPNPQINFGILKDISLHLTPVK